MFLRLFKRAIITCYMSTKLFVSSIYFTGFSIILMYLLFQRASLAPFITRDFYAVNAITSVFSIDLASFPAFVSKIYTVSSTCGYFAS